MNIQDQMLSALHHLYISTHMYVPILSRLSSYLDKSLTQSLFIFTCRQIYLVPVHYLFQMEALLKKTLDFFAAAWRKLLFGWGAHCFLGWDNNLDFLKDNNLDILKDNNLDLFNVNNLDILKDNNLDFLKDNNLDFLKDINLDFLKDKKVVFLKDIDNLDQEIALCKRIL